MEENKKAAQKKKISHAIIMVVLILLFLMFIFPFILVIINAFKTKGDIMSDPMALVGSHGFIVTNFSDAMKKMNFTTSFTNSLIITVSATIGTILLSAMTAFVIVRNNWKACKLLFNDCIYGNSIPGFDDSVSIIIWWYLWSFKQPCDLNPYAYRIFTFNGNIHVPWSNSYEYSVRA